MFQKMVEKLIENLPRPSVEEEQEQGPLKIDLVLEGGAFNGSYMLGILYFLKNLEEKKKIQVDRISGVSIGSILGLIYHLDRLDFTVSFYKSVYKHLKKKKNLSIIHTFCNEIHKILPEDFYITIHKKLFITYYDFDKGKKIVKSTYKNNQEIIDTVIKSGYIPFICGKSCFHQNKYADGLFPHVFSLKSTEKTQKKILYISLSHHDKIFNMFIVKKEKNNIQRIMVGILDAYSFFYKREKTNMCSYLDQWNILDKGYSYLKKILEIFFFWNLWLFYILERYVLDEITHTFFHKLFYQLLHHFYRSIIEWYCI